MAVQALANRAGRRRRLSAPHATSASAHARLPVTSSSKSRRSNGNETPKSNAAGSGAASNRPDQRCWLMSPFEHDHVNRARRIGTEAPVAPTGASRAPALGSECRARPRWWTDSRSARRASSGCRSPRPERPRRTAICTLAARSRRDGHVRRQSARPRRTRPAAGCRRVPSSPATSLELALRDRPQPAG